MNSYKGVIFDFNGTLFFDNPKHVLAWGKISEEIRHHGISEEELHEHFNGVPNNKIIEYLFEGQCTDEQKQTLKTAMEQSSRYRFASYIVLGLAAKDAIGLGKDAGSAIKTMGVLDAAKSKEVKGIVSTANMAKGLLGSTQSEFSEYDKNSHEAKQLLNPKEAKSTDADVADLAKKAMDGGFFF